VYWTRRKIEGVDNELEDAMERMRKKGLPIPEPCDHWLSDEQKELRKKCKKRVLARA
jgi:hypothetical protein